MIKKKEFNIAIACEITPAKTIIPIIEKLKELEDKNKLNWIKTNFIGLNHGEATKNLLKPYCNEIYSIGEGRNSNKIKTKTNNFKLAYLIFKDIIKAFNALRGKKIDILITCGNAGDVRKSIIPAKILKIPVLHIEQDIYNPIEMIPFVNLITAPSKKYEKYINEVYGLNNIKNIKGYPMAIYIDKLVNQHQLDNNDNIFNEYGIDKNKFQDFILFLLGGDLKYDDLNELIIAILKIQSPIIIVPYRFESEAINDLINSEKSKINNFNQNIKVLTGFVDLIELAMISKAIVYGAGMGMTIEVGVLNIPSIKIKGFHNTHASVDLANELNIPIVEINKIPEKINEINSLTPKSNDLVTNGKIAIDEIIKIINNFNFNNKKFPFKSVIAIWKERSRFR